MTGISWKWLEIAQNSKDHDNDKYHDSDKNEDNDDDDDGDESDDAFFCPIPIFFDVHKK